MKFRKARVVAPGTRIETDIPGRLDRLPWSPWHRRVVTALGVTWILDGLEVTIVGAVATALADRATLNLTETEIGTSASFYLVGAVLGSLLFGRLTDRLGRKRLFLVTLMVYVSATLLTAFAWDFWSFAIFRALTGAGIGGEYSAINSAIDELIPAKLRGRIDLAVNSTYWAGTALGSLSTLILLNPNFVSQAIGWRIAFGMGGVLGFLILFTRRHMPESPRWLLMHGRLAEAEKVVTGIERAVEASTGETLTKPEPKEFEVKGTISLRVIARSLVHEHRQRSILGFTLMVAQAFAYNAILFTYALVLSRFYQVPTSSVGLYLLPFALGNLLGPLVLGRLFDTIGRRFMITATYGSAGLLLAATGYAFTQGWLTAYTQTALWCAVFFVASAAASSAYLTVSELFPVEMRGMAIALFYSAGTGAGGVAAPALLGALIQTGDRFSVFLGYLVAAVLMILAAVVAALYSVKAEGKSLEDLGAEPSVHAAPELSRPA